MNITTQESANTFIYSLLLQPKKQPAERLDPAGKLATITLTRRECFYAKRTTVTRTTY